MPDSFPCGHPKSVENSRLIRNGTQSRCRICNNAASLKWQRDNPQKVKDRYDTWRFKNKAKINDAQFKHRHGLKAHGHYDLQIKKQNNKCAICKNIGEKFNQDHDHSCCPYFLDSSGNKRIKACGNCARGLLCTGCNSKLGHIEQIVKDNPNLVVTDSWLDAARSYLQYWQDVIEQ